MKKARIFTLAMGLVVIMTFPAMAGEWKKDSNGWWYQNDNGSYLANGWKWIDGNGDGLSEAYYFCPDGYLATNLTTTEGFVVNGDGAWTVRDVVQFKENRENDYLPGVEAQDIVTIVAE